MRVIVLACFSACLTAAVSAAPPELFDCGGAYFGTSFARNLSDDGLVLGGEAETNGAGVHAQRWWVDDARVVHTQDLGAFAFAQSQCSDLNGDGTVAVGTSGVRAYRWTQATGMVSLGVLPGFANSGALAVSRDGETVLGGCSSPNRVGAPFLWTRTNGSAGVMTAIPIPPGHDSVELRGLSGDGRTVFGRCMRGNYADGFVWTLERGYQFLPGANGYTGWPTAICHDGSVIVGTCPQAARWFVAADGSIVGPIILPGVPDGTVIPEAIDSTGRVIGGWIYRVPASQAFIWRRETGVLTVREYVASLGTDPSGWAFQYVRGIGDGGTSIGLSGGHDSHGITPVLVRGLPPADPCPADLNRDGILDFFDYADFIEAFEAGAPLADYGRDGFTDYLDYIEFVADFEHGC